VFLGISFQFLTNKRYPNIPSKSFELLHEGKVENDFLAKLKFFEV